MWLRTKELIEGGFIYLALTHSFLPYHALNLNQPSMLVWSQLHVQLKNMDFNFSLFQYIYICFTLYIFLRIILVSPIDSIKAYQFVLDSGLIKGLIGKLLCIYIDLLYKNFH